MRTAHVRLLFSALISMTSVACADRALLPPPDGKLAFGTWGGENAALIATDSVTHVHFGCTFGDMPPNVQLDGEGRFVIVGNYMLHAYPIAYGPTMPAQFSGQVLGNQLTMSVSVSDTVEKKTVAFGPVTVTLGRTPTMGPCPVCSVPRAMVTGVHRVGGERGEVHAKPLKFDEHNKVRKGAAESLRASLDP